MYATLGRRAAEFLVGMFAVLGFAYVPLGHKTGLEHLLNIARTPAVADAVHDATQALIGVKERVWSKLDSADVSPRKPRTSPHIEH